MPRDQKTSTKANKQKGTGGDRRQLAKQRRHFIARHVSLHGRLAVATLEATFGKTHPQSLRDDLRSLNQSPLHTFFIHQGDIVDAGVPRHTEHFGERRYVNRDEKNLIAELVHSLVVGFPNNSVSATQHPLARIYTIDEIIGKLSFCGEAAKGTAHRVQAKLKDYFSITSRTIALDDGTTNTLIAQALAKLTVPVASTKLNHLTVATNSRTIFNILGQETVQQIRAIIIGGQQRGRSTVIAGTLAEFFLRSATLLQFDATIVGAAGLSSSKGLVFSDSEEEAVIKGILFGKSSLRIIALDSAKLSFGSTSRGFSFCSLDPQFCDLVITNSPIAAAVYKASSPDPLTEQSLTIREFPRLIEEIEGRGIPVLIAYSQSTAFAQDCPKNRLLLRS